jgi:hypothetical protein
MKIVNWSFITSSDWGVNHPECTKPLIDKDYVPLTNLTKHIVAERKGVIFLKCPAFTDFMKNTFVFHAPFDLTIDIEVNDETGDGKLFCPNISQEVFETIIDTRFLFDRDRGIDPYPLIGLDWLTMFQTSEPMLIQLLPAFLHYNDFTNKTAVIPGEFDISKWTRSVEVVFEVKKNKERIEIKKGDAIAYMKFHSDEIVKLIEQETPWTESKICAELRAAKKGKPLKDRYEELDKIRKQECPYGKKSQD